MKEIKKKRKKNKNKKKREKKTKREKERKKIQRDKGKRESACLPPAIFHLGMSRCRDEKHNGVFTVARIVKRARTTVPYMVLYGL